MRKIVLTAAVVLIVVAGGGAAWHFITRPSAELVKTVYWAVREGDVRKIDALLAQNSRVAKAKYKGSHSMLVTATCTYSPIPNQTEVCRLLLDHGANPNENSGAPLHGAIYCANADLAKLFDEQQSRL